MRPQIPTALEESTTGLCPKCLIEVPARLYADDDGRVWLTKVCAAHGESRALLSGDANEYLRIRQYVPDRSAGGCCGIGGAGEGACGPPTCILLLEITEACNLRCPTCFAAAHGHDFMTVDEARRRLDSFFASQSTLDVLMLSGGEPTIHPQFDEMIELALSYPVERVLVNTNGLRTLQSEPVCEAIARRRDQVELYLSFSSFRPAVHERLYGRDLLAEKRDVVDLAERLDILTTLVMTVERGVNDDEIGDFYRYALSKRNVNGLTFQPAMSAGRYEHEYDPEERMTLTDVIAALESQTGGALVKSDFVGLPCSHPDCCALTYGLLDEARTTITPLPRHLDVARYMDLLADRISFSGLVGSALRKIWSEVGSMRGARTVRGMAELFAAAGVRDFLPLIGKPEKVKHRVIRIVVKPFMDAHTYDVRRIEQCCTKIVDERGEAVSLCQYNVFRRGATVPARTRSAVGLPMA